MVMFLRIRCCCFCWYIVVVVAYGDDALMVTRYDLITFCVTVGVFAQHSFPLLSFAFILPSSALYPDSPFRFIVVFLSFFFPFRFIRKLSLHGWFQSADKGDFLLGGREVVWRGDGRMMLYGIWCLRRPPFSVPWYVSWVVDWRALLEPLTVFVTLCPRRGWLESLLVPPSVFRHAISALFVDFVWVDDKRVRLFWWRWWWDGATIF